MTTAHIFISGFVQGIGYRQFVKKHAEELGLTGWVKNLSDGRVEVMFQGEKTKIEDVVKLCKKGPFMAEVEDVIVSWDDIEDQLTTFETIHE